MYDLINERARGLFSLHVKSNLRFGFILFITSEVLFFFRFFWTFFHRSLAPCTGDWPPLGLTSVALHIPLLNTGLLLLRGLTLTWAHHCFSQGFIKEGYVSHVVTVLLGRIFIGVQAFEYLNRSFSIRDSVYGRIFYLATGFHGCHVALGSVILIGVLFLYPIMEGAPTYFSLAAWYWHFVDVVWLFLFICVYWWGCLLYFTDSCSRLHEMIVSFRDFSHLIIVFVGRLVFLTLYNLTVSSFSDKSLYEARFLETLWTLGPCVILLILAFPSLLLLYTTDLNEPKNMIRVSGRQWYWVYGDRERYMLKGITRNLDCSNPLLAKTNVSSIVGVRSGDVIHRWAIPSLGIKADAVPGRINSTRLLRARPGLFYGQCSEICGANHRFIPILVNRV